MRVGAVWLLTVAVIGCDGSTGPSSTDTSSAAIPSLGQRVEFLQRYVTFRREYRALDFHVVYHNNGEGRVPGPSDWDIRLVAAVPPEELASWVPAGATTVSASDSNWLDGVPGAQRAAAVTEWYSAPGRIIGVDRVRSIVAYRSWSR
ncbi:MAG: hypothetical protein ACLQGP_12875 [Isosphaeraceae bacterium]